MKLPDKPIDYEQALQELALDIHWSWSHASDEIWKRLDPVLWELTYNPLVILRTISALRVRQVLEDQEIRDRINDYLENKKQTRDNASWFQRAYPFSPLSTVAYFSMEYMLSEALPIYSGGLGNVAGDHLKTASDLGVPVVAVGLLYQQGYVHQVIDENGFQQNYFPYNDPDQLPMRPLRTESGEWLRIEVPLPGYSMWLRTWQVQVGNIQLLLLDSNDPANFPPHRGITSELYGAGAELRLMQEMVLGIGGWRLLKCLGYHPEVCHLNEGHAAFVILERAADFMENNGVSFEVALAATRSGNLFTTHTAIGAGFDTFDSKLIEKFLAAYAQNRLGIPVSSLLALGRQDLTNATEGFNMTSFSIKGSGYINAVSRKHATVSKSIFSALFKRWPVSEIPIGYITNGVHMPTWDSIHADALWTEACGKERWLETVETLGQRISKLPDERIWKMRQANRKDFIVYLRKRYSRQLGVMGMDMIQIEDARKIWDPDVLTIGFGRRFVPYKRPTLLLYNPDRFFKILSDTSKPVQFILAGKAHPEDTGGQHMIKQWIDFIHQYNLEKKVIFLSDYDMKLTEQMVQGVDLWINTPRRPWEACGTSGMKVLVNGGLNISVKDGWWEEAFTPEVGWAIGENNRDGSAEQVDAEDAESLYRLLEEEIIPAFYNRNENNLPVSWIQKIRASMALLTPQYSANRSLREYTNTYYIPAALKYKNRAADKGSLSCSLVKWNQLIKEKWATVWFESVLAEGKNGSYYFQVALHLDPSLANYLLVEIYAEGLHGRPPEKYKMKMIGKEKEEDHLVIYTGNIISARPISDFTPRVIPVYEGVSHPLENQCILWAR